MSDLYRFTIAYLAAATVVGAALWLLLQVSAWWEARKE